MSVVGRWIGQRRELARSWAEIAQVEADADALVEELRCRRDGLHPTRRFFPHLRRALDLIEVRPVDAEARGSAEGKQAE